MPVVIRPARLDDRAVLQDIERLAGERFRDVGLDEVADDEPHSLDVLATYAAHGRAWVAVADGGQVVGYVVVDIVDDSAHVEQVSVVPAHQGTGAGRALLERVQAWAVMTNRRSVTLTTFADVPWNRPLYEHLGFRVLPEERIGPELRAVRDVEAAHGLDPKTRVCMGLDVTLGTDRRAGA